MMSLLEVAAVSYVLLFAITWTAVVFFSPSKARSAATANERIVKARAWLYAPIWAPLVVLVGTFGGPLWSALSGGPDHCATGHFILPHLHHHMCFVHPPTLGGGGWIWALPAVFALGIAWACSDFFARAKRERRLTETLVALGREMPMRTPAPVLELDQEEPLALTAGWPRPKVLLSRGLQEALTAESLQVVLAHEFAHVSRRDTFWALLDRTAACLFPAVVCEALLADIALGTEQACDDHAAHEHGELKVARALAEVARLGLAPAQLGLSVSSAALRARVEYLLATPTRSSSGRLRSLVGAGILLAAGIGPVHSAVELMLCLLVHPS